jgi:type IV secretory pathway VirB2 component (pilin)
MTGRSRSDPTTAEPTLTSSPGTFFGRGHRAGWRDGVFVGLAIAAFAATMAQAGQPFGSAHVLRLLQDLLDPPGEHVIALSGIVLIGGASLLGCLLLRLRWRGGLAVVALAWWSLVAFAFWQERVIGDSVSLPLPAAALAAVYALSLLLRPATQPAVSKTGAGSGVKAEASVASDSIGREGRSGATGRSGRAVGLKARAAARA